MAEYKIRIVVEGDDRASGPLNSASSSLQRIGEFATGGLVARGISSIGRGLVDVTGDALSAYAGFERMEFALKSLVARETLQRGGAESMGEALQLATGQTEDLVGWVEQLAVLSPFNQEDVFNAFRLSMAYGFTSDSAQRLTQTMVDFAAGSGQTGAVMNRIALALGQIKGRGKLSAQEINQLTEAGVNARQILADAFNVTTGELETMVSNGLIPAGDAIDAIVGSLETDFAGAAERSSGTFQGLTSSLQDLKEIGLRNVFGPMFQAIQPQLAALVDTLSSDSMTTMMINFGERMGAALGVLIDKGGQLVDLFLQMDPVWQTWIAGAAAAAVAIAPLAGGLVGIGAMLAVAAPLISAVATAFMALVSPVGLVAAGIAALVAFDVGGIGTGLRNLAGNLLAALKPVQEALRNLMSGKGSFAEVGQAAMGAMQQVAIDIGQWFSNIDWSAVAEGGKNMFAGLVSQVGSWLGMVDWSGLAESGITMFSGAAAQVRDTIVQALADAFAEMDMTAIMTGVLDALTSGLEKIDFTKIGEGVRSAFTLMFNMLKLQIFGALMAINWVMSAEDFGSLKTAVTGAIRAIDWGAVVESLTAFKDAVVGAFSDFFSGLFGEGQTFTWPELPEFTWPPYLTFTWPSFPTWTWPALPTWTWPSIPRPTWQWPSIPRPTWQWPSLPTSGLFGGSGRAIGDASWRGGLVNVHRDEVLSLPRGTRIFNRSEAAGLAGAGAGLQIGTVVINNEMDMVEFERRVERVLFRRR